MRNRIAATNTSGSTLQNFAASKSGNVSIIFGCPSSPCSPSRGGAIDFARWFSVKNKTQAAIDAQRSPVAARLQLSLANDTTARDRCRQRATSIR